MSKHFDRLRNEHKDFDFNKSDEDFGSDPIDAFNKWFDDACNANETEPNAFCLSTADVNSLQPSSRILYLKDLRNQELVFYTNYESEKGKQIEGNSNVSMLFFWPEMQRQVRIQGKAYKTSNEESDSYFKTRPRSSQVGAWASNQSQLLDSSAELKERVEAIEIKFPGDIPRPDFWGGYAVKAELFEFWQGKPSRLHDRLIFKLENGKWKSFRKNP